jgi:hypothetical protein
VHSSLVFYVSFLSFFFSALLPCLIHPCLCTRPPAFVCALCLCTHNPCPAHTHRPLFMHPGLCLCTPASAHTPLPCMHASLCSHTRPLHVHPGLCTHTSAFACVSRPLHTCTSLYAHPSLCMHVLACVMNRGGGTQNPKTRDRGKLMSPCHTLSHPRVTRCDM